MSGILTGAEIMKQRADGKLLIEPFNLTQINPNSYDVCLGEKFLYISEKSSRIYIPGKSKQWIEGTAETWENVQSSLLSNHFIDENDLDDELDPDTLVIPILPGETILAHTDEFIGSLPGVAYTMLMQSKSKFGRSFISVCKCAGMGSTGYCNRWTMEIQNNSKDKIIPLIVGQPIAQIIFMSAVGEITSYSGKYQVSLVEEMKIKNIEEKIKTIYNKLLNNWSVELLKP